ncbi:cytosolic phospholipase A2 gamma isoform X1 [Mesocricetus auratus]|uniref:Cytosolic phospholipase A2 gamma isoform X1 n=1 Tax=Mesocricetus auratus TaxID=10036 RepID=A0A3Q0CER8_MESAU|nr:cytosolic phospholipase A2 gamma isoform X1 [Mesocricetus auratus]XP_021079093.2 cytosolic phospholipase A2 gamma isoform X1 [Mesocricetus auratus]XP_040590402.1 cytosolic phospholipase A2 gamma isoform X1 [Mesocricetus auratus]XP_040590403.1 cytosolic phospholipase A2 gamma isoform X1 [Mesocricetus auratus]
MNPEESSKSQPCSTHERSGVYFATGFQEAEKVALNNRSPKVLEALQKLDIQVDQAPVIAVLGSGGGLRAHIAYLGVLSEMKELGLLDAVTYLAGVSGSTWALSSFYINNGNTEGMEEELKQRYDNSWQVGESLKKAIQAARRENYSMTDFWAYFVVSRQMRDLENSNLSSIKKPVEEGMLPYPIFAAIDGDLQPDWRKRKTQKSWFEFTPHHAGYPALGAYVPITEFGSRFEDGKLVKSEPERDLTYLRGLWGSALADTDVIKKFICDMLVDLRAKLKQGHLRAAGAEIHMEAPEMPVTEALLDLMMAYVTDQNDPSIKDKLQALQQVLSAERDEFGEQKYTWLTEIVQNWNEISPKEKEQFLEYLLYCFMRTEEFHKGSMYSSMNLIRGLLQDTFNFLSKTGICCWRWEWGTVYNFLYKNGNITDEAMQSREFLHLVDAGLAINTPYPLVLPPAREAHLILSFDFSAGDPLETIRATADYCQRHAIPFPDVREDQLKEWARAPASCYILRGETGPVVMHFTLFNKDTCGDDIETWRKKYETMKLSDFYTPDLVTDLLRVSKENVQINKDSILNEIRKVAGKTGSFLGINKDCWRDTVQDVQSPRTVEIKISNNTDITFKEPLHYLQSGHVLVDPPPELSPKSTISCSFVKKSSSFQGTVGILVYQGPSAHVALLFSVPFNYALHRTEFALAIITEPVSRNLESVFDDITQGNGSPELKAAKYDLQIPQGTLKLEHDSLIIRATVSNIHVAKMDVVLETKAP